MYDYLRLHYGNRIATGFLLACGSLRVGIELSMVVASLWFLCNESDRAWKLAVLLLLLDIGMAVKDIKRN